MASQLPPETPALQRECEYVHTFVCVRVYDYLFGGTCVDERLQGRRKRDRQIYSTTRGV